MNLNRLRLSTYGHADAVAVSRTGSEAVSE